VASWNSTKRFVHDFAVASARVDSLLCNKRCVRARVISNTADRNRLMRKIAIIIALMFIARIGYEQIMYRSATYDVIVATYAKSAIRACARDAANPEAAAALWSQPSSVKLVIGKSDLDVYFWQVNDLMWQARFKNPYLFITTHSEPNYLLCEYDIMRRSAFVQKM